MISAKWIHKKRHYCDGEWHLIIDDIDFSREIPSSAKYGPMDTYREYVFWTLTHEGVGSRPVWVRGTYGEPFEVWQTTHPWVKRIVVRAKERGIVVTEEEIYNAFLKNDFMRASCGECLLKDQKQYKEERREALKNLPDPEKFLTPEEVEELQRGIEKVSSIKPVGINAQRQAIRRKRKHAKLLQPGTYNER